MRHHSYDPATGIFTGRYFYTSEENEEARQRAVAKNTVAGHKTFETDDTVGHLHLSHRLDLATKELIDYLPPAPTENHEWDSTVKRWVMKRAVLDKRSQLQQLEFSAQRLMRKAVLGNADAIAQLRIIEQQIDDLEKGVTN